MATERQTVREFARAILHGDEQHRAWLLEAAECFVDGRPLPPPTAAGSLPDFAQEWTEACRRDLEVKSVEDVGRIYHLLTTRDPTRLSRQAWATLRWIAMLRSGVQHGD